MVDPFIGLVPIKLEIKGFIVCKDHHKRPRSKPYENCETCMGNDKNLYPKSWHWNTVL